MFYVWNIILHDNYWNRFFIDKLIYSFVLELSYNNDKRKSSNYLLLRTDAETKSICVIILTFIWFE